MGHAVARVRINDGKIELIFGRVQIDEEIIDFVQDFLGPSIGPVNLVEHNDRRQLRRQGLLQNVARLRQRPFARVHQHYDAVHHAQCALHFAAKVAMPGSIHDIDFRVMKKKCSIFRENSDAALAFQVVRIHHALDDGFVGTKNSALLEHGINERSLAVVHVRDDCYVANTLTHMMASYDPSSRVQVL